MRTWNNVSSRDLETVVVGKYTIKEGVALSRPSGPSSSSVAVKIILGIALASTLTFGAAQFSSSNKPIAYATPDNSVAVFQTLEEQPPLELLPAFRISREQRQREKDLLTIASKNRVPDGYIPTPDEVVEVIFSNQQEDIAESVNRLSKERLTKLIQRRRA